MIETMLRWNRLWSLQNFLIPFPIPIIPSVTDIREWKVETEPMGLELNKPLSKTGCLNVALHRILIETGIAQTPATSSWDPRSWYALFRYGGDFAGTEPRLRFYSGVKDKDPRLIAVASEEIATGISCYILREHFGLVHIADVYPCIQRGELKYVKEGTESRPDYFCEDADGKTVIAESKGSTGTRSSITPMIDPKGLEQVQNVVPVNLALRESCSRVVIGTNFCIDGMHPKSETTTVINDPDGEEGKDLDPESDQLMRLAYAKVLRFMGQDSLSELLINRTLERFDFRLWAKDMLRSVSRIPFLPMGVTVFGDVIGFYGPVGEALLSSGNGSMQSAIRSALRGVSASSRDENMLPDKLGYMLSNGVMIIHDAEFVE